jgi:alpha-2-macroglobulin
VSTAPDVATDGGLALSYALYVLARNGMAPVGDLRYIADVKLSAVSTPAAKGQVAAALAMLGDRLRSEKAFNAALGALPVDSKLNGRADYGSPLRDAAALVTLAAEGNASNVILVGATEEIETARDRVTLTSTQENAWLVLAARALGKQNVKLTVNNGTEQGPLYRRFTEGEIAKGPLVVANSGDVPLDAVISVSGAPTTPEPEAEHGFNIVRSFHALDGSDADVSKARQNDRIVVVLSVTEPQPEFARVALTDYLPAGFEIDNPHLVSSGDTGTIDWIENTATPVHTEFRDDRFTAAFERRKADPVTFRVAYIVRAVSPGHYVLPQAVVEDMYRPDRFGRTGTGTVEVAPAK